MIGEMDLQKAGQFIREYDRFLVMSHVNPDGDAVGSVLAMAHLLRFLNKQFVMISDGSLPRRFAYLDSYDQVIDISHAQVDDGFEHVIALDAADEGRLGAAFNFIPEAGRILNIDHHPTNTKFGQVNIIRPQAASTTEILYDLVSTEFSAAFSYELAQALYTGLLTDTGGFRYDNTTRKVLQIAADLLSYGVQPGKVAELALETMSMTQFELMKRALQKLTLDLNHKVAMISVTREDMRLTGAHKDDVDGLVSYPRMLEGVEVAVVLKEIDTSEIKVSLRSKCDINVAKMAQAFGGGGHAKAAGFTFSGSLQQARAQLLSWLQDNVERFRHLASTSAQGDTGGDARRDAGREAGLDVGDTGPDAEGDTV